MKTWADAAKIEPPSTTLDRDAGEGPTPRCCNRRLVAADALVHYGDLAGELLAKVSERFPQLADVPDAYLCDSCRELLRRERVIARDEMPRAWAPTLPDAI